MDEIGLRLNNDDNDDHEDYEWKRTFKSREEADDWLNADIGFFGAPRKGQVL